jgi:restriction endonuclease S subunit
LANVINFLNIEKSGNTIAQLTTPMVEKIKIPVPDKKIQQKIVDEIKAELDKQEEIKKQIEEERNKIDEIIEKAIK